MSSEKNSNATATENTPETFPLTENTATATVEQPAAETNGKAKGKGGKKAKPEAKTPDQLADAIAKKQEAMRNEKIVKENMKALASGWKPESPKLYNLKDPKVIVFDRRLQMRNTGKEASDEKLVTDYADIMKERTKERPDAPAHGFTNKQNGGFPAIKAVRVTDADKEAHGLTGNIVVWDGFHTGAAWLTIGGKEFPIEVMDGTFRFAKLLALGANSDHGKQRSDADRRFMFKQVIEDADLLSDAIELSKSRSAAGKNDKGEWTGGLNRALADVCGISKGAVSKWLKELGKTTKGNKIVDAPKEEAPPPHPVADAESVKETMSKMEFPEVTMGGSTAEKLAAAIRLHTAFCKAIAEAFKDEVAKDIVVESANKWEYPIVLTSKTGDDGQTVNSFSWPVVEEFAEMLDEVAFRYSQAVRGEQSPTPNEVEKTAGEQPQPTAAQ